MASDWYCRIDDKEYGPLAPEGLRSMAVSGQLTQSHYVRRGAVGDWLPATRVKGLFEVDAGHRPPAAEAASAGRLAEPSPARRTQPAAHIRSVADCVSAEEKEERFGVTVINCFLWLFLTAWVLLTMGLMLIPIGAAWIIGRLLSEYNVRKLQALGTTATKHQFPEIVDALEAVCDQFEIADIPKVIILNVSSINAFALRFARKKVIVLLSQTLEGVLDQPAELRFILAHELAHIVLDHGARGTFEMYKSAPYKAARELTCDNCGCAAAGDLDSAKTMLKRLGVGNLLHQRLDEDYMITESRYIYSGFTGWLVKQYLTHPPLGKRIANATQFAEANSCA